MVRGNDVQEFLEMKRAGLRIQAISELTGYDRKTVRKHLLKPETVPRVTDRVHRGPANWTYTSRTWKTG